MNGVSNFLLWYQVHIILQKMNVAWINSCRQNSSFRLFLVASCSFDKKNKHTEDKWKNRIDTVTPIYIIFIKQLQRFKSPEFMNNGESATAVCTDLTRNQII